MLQIDDAFAGGVCRCDHCGAIQTVPAREKGKVVGKSKPAKTLYRKSRRDEAMPSSGLDQLAQALAGSGLSGSLEKAKPLHKKSPARMALFAFGVIGVIVALAIAAMKIKPAERPQAGPSGPGPEAIAAAPVAAPAPPPNFCGVPINDQVVIYVLDRGSGTTDLFSYLKEATYKSVESLGPERKFQIIFWNNGTDDAFPLSAPAYASAANLDSARKALDGIFAFGQSDALPALTRAVANNPQAIILATAKGPQLDDAFADQVTRIVKDHSIKVHTFDLGNAEVSNALRTIAQQTGGESHSISEADLKRSAR